MAWAPPQQIPLVIRPPTRLVASGTIVLLANSSMIQAPNIPAFFSGSNNRQERIQIVVTNLDPTLYIKWQTASGLNAGTIFAQLPWTLETSADIVLYNPNGSNVTIEVAELYPDTGNLHGVPQRIAAQVAGSGAAGTTGGTSGSGGGTSGGGGGGGGSFGGGYGGGTAQPP